MIRWWLVCWAAVSATTVCNDPLTNTLSVASDGSAIPCRSAGEIAELDTTRVGEFCFSQSQFSNNSFTVRTEKPFVVRRMQLLPIGRDWPKSVRVSGAVGAADPAWYVSSRDRDLNAAWSNVMLSGDMLSFADSSSPQFTSLSVFTNGTSAATPQSVVGFGLRMFGCAAETTGDVKYVFNSSSASAVEMSFGTVSLFTRKILNLVKQETQIHAERFLTAADMNVGGNVTITITVLPDSAVGAPSVTELVAELSTNEALISKLKDLQTWIVDMDKQLCVRKMCPRGSLCVNGSCMAADGSVANATELVTSDANLRRILATAPTLLGADVETNNDRRLWIPLTVVGSVVLVVAIILTMRVVNRQRRVT